MPTYLVHGFRWHRTNIRIYIILNDIDDATSEWVMAPPTSNAILNSFYTQFDFLPPSRPGPINLSPEPSPTECSSPPAKSPPGTPLTKKTKRSMISLKSPSLRSKASLVLRKANSNGQNYFGSPASDALHVRSPPGPEDHVPRAMHIPGAEKPLRFNQWSVVKLVEQYDPEDLKTLSQPWAYVSDYMVEVGLGVSITEEMKKYEEKIREEEFVPPDAEQLGISAREIRRKNRRAGWFNKLREKLDPGEEMGWFVVVCGDEERWAPPVDLPGGMQSTNSCTEGEIEGSQARRPKSAGLRGFFRRKTAPLENINVWNNGNERGLSRGDDSTYGSVKNTNVRS
ncbi:hypothetical protein DSL72_005201 [Monilinia vaccinii-corymbosi]|uniref:Developmental regulator protein n=1 Tax=Monilinia vaccinii-corymbosi TaxID=61207 RepID=A0A8A3PEZ4_9HELO|nr:hypothetical protein DSL72_005201 [Monilinia vaccinii-corymbosi]